MEPLKRRLQKRDPRENRLQWHCDPRVSLSFWFWATSDGKSNVAVAYLYLSLMDSFSLIEKESVLEMRMTLSTSVKDKRIEEERDEKGIFPTYIHNHFQARHNFSAIPSLHNVSFHHKHVPLYPLRTHQALFDGFVACCWNRTAAHDRRSLVAVFSRMLQHGVERVLFVCPSHV